MPGFERRPKRGDKGLPAKFLNAGADELRRLNKISASGGMSNGPGGIAFPDLRDDAAAMRIIQTPGYLPAAFGGLEDTATTYWGPYIENNDLAIEYGNFIPDGETGATFQNIKLYPFDCEEWRYSGERLEKSGNTIKVANLGRLPSAMGAFYWVAPIEGEDVFGLVAPLTRFDSPAAGYQWGPPGLSGGEYRGTEQNTIRFVRTRPAPMTDFMRQNGAFVVEPGTGDLFITHPGTYKITWGARLFHYADVGDGTPAGAYYQADTTSTVAGGTSHVHKTTTFFGLHCRLHLIENWVPGVDITTEWNSGDLDVSIAAGIYVPPAFPQSVAEGYGERTRIRRYQADNAHGGLYTRLSLALEVLGDSSNHTPPAGKLKIGCREAWMIISPVEEIFGGSGTGINYAFADDGTYHWWGGGPEPAGFDDKGLELTP